MVVAAGLLLSVGATAGGWMLPGEDIRTEGVLPEGVSCERSVSRDGEATRVRFEIRNEGAGTAVVEEGAFGFLFPFDSVFERGRRDASSAACVSHVWCGGDVAWVWAAHPDGSKECWSAVLVEGSVTSYSLHCDVTRAQTGAFYRGSPVLNPPRLELAPGEARAYAFRVLESDRRPDRDEMPGNVLVSTETFSPFVGEAVTLRLSAEGRTEERRLSFDSPGEKVVPVEAFGRRMTVRFQALEDLETVLQRRARFIVRHQQAGPDRGNLDGAYLIYDRRSGETVVGKGDHNAGRERLSMGVLVAMAARRTGDPELAASLARHRAFVLRELFDPRDGTVFNEVGRNNAWHRNYNYPWMSVYWLETWRLTRDVTHLRYAAGVLRAYYESRGGFRQESPCLYVLETIRELEAAGLADEAKALGADLVRHADDILSRSGKTTSEEVTVTHGGPNIRGSILAQALLLTGDVRYRTELELELARAEAFCARTPDARTDLQPVRHWDGFWFGGERLYGDTFPQWLGGLNGEMYYYAGKALGRDYGKLVACNLRGLLSAFGPDGFASCAYYPFLKATFVQGEGPNRPFVEPSVRRGLRWDPWANDQDWSLCFAVRFLPERKSVSSVTRSGGVDRGFLSRLLEIPSVTADLEQVNRAVEFVRGDLEAAGVACVEERDAQDRKVLYASTRPGRVQDYLLVVHLDVVPADAGQFRPRIDGGRIYARGAHDCKGNAAIAVQLLKDLNGKASVGVVFAADEEQGGSTTGLMVSRGYLAKKLVIVVDAGTDGVYYAQKGNCYIRVRAVGRGGHSSRPMELDNPIDRLMDGWTKFKAVWPKVSADGWCDLVSATRLEAGEADNRIPDTADMTVNLRSVSADAPDRAVRMLKDVGLEVVNVRSTGLPMTSDRNDPAVKRLLAARRLTWPERKPEFQRMMAITDARHFATSGVPAVIIGSSGGDSHGKDEWADLKSIDENLEMLERFCADEGFGRE